VSGWRNEEPIVIQLSKRDVLLRCEAKRMKGEIDFEKMQGFDWDNYRRRGDPDIPAWATCPTRSALGGVIKNVRCACVLALGFVFVLVIL
jgi:hypothetical protein